MRLHVLYRLYPPESMKRRPPFHSKQLCLRSVVRSLEDVPGSRLVLLVDADELPPEYDGVVPPGTETHFYGGIGNGPSYQRQLGLVADLPPDDLVYLCEDDYLFSREAFPVFVAAAEETREIDYFSLYDHPDRYTRDDDAKAVANRYVWYVAGHHWRWCESSCMTFGGRVRTFHEDMGVHRRFRPRGSFRNNVVMRALRYNDRRFWRLLQGVAPYRWKRPKRRLASVIPSLSTHMDTPFLAPGVDWAAVAATVDAP